MVRLSLLAVIALIALTCGFLIAADKEGERQVEGKIKTLNVGKMTITVTTKDGKDEQFDIAVESKVKINDKAANITDVKEGASVTLIVKANGRGRVVEIRVKKED